MIALAMLHAVVVAALVGLAAACLERALRLTGRTTRGIWAAAMVASVAAPFALPLLAGADSRDAAPPTADAIDAVSVAALLARARVVDVATSAEISWDALDRPLGIAWIAASAGALAWLALSRRRLRGVRRDWAAARVDDVDVLVAPDVGPAAIAADGGRIIVPAWALELDRERRTLMLAHERAHLHARDPQLLTAAMLLVALMPWNAALWWQLRRLRVAMEIDCDGRVLRRHPDVSAYGALLLDVARRRGDHRPLFATAFSAPAAATALERRIRTMTARRPRHAALRAIAAASLAAALVAVACETPRPTELRPTAQVPLTDIRVASRTTAAATPAPTDERLKAAIREHAPGLLVATGERQTLWIVEDANGRVAEATYAPSVRREVPRSIAALPSATTLDAGAIAGIDVYKVAEGRIAPDGVDVLWIRLRPAGAAASSEASAPRVAVRAPAPTPRSGAEPIVVIDGKRASPTADGRSPLDALTPDSIATIDVLKGERAVAAYGESGRNGVIVVRTNRRTIERY